MSEDQFDGFEPSSESPMDDIPIIDAFNPLEQLALEEGDMLYRDHCASMLKISDEYLREGMHLVTTETVQYLIYHLTTLLENLHGDYVNADALRDLIVIVEKFFECLKSRLSPEYHHSLLVLLEQETVSLDEAFGKLRTEIKEKLFAHRSHAIRYVLFFKELFSVVGPDLFAQMKEELTDPFRSLIALAVMNLNGEDYVKYVETMEQHERVQAYLEETELDVKCVTDHLELRVFVAYHETFEDDPYYKFFSFLRFKNEMMDVAVPLPSYLHFLDIFQGVVYFVHRNEGLEVVDEKFTNTSVVQAEFFTLSDLKGMQKDRVLKLQSSDSLLELHLSSEVFAILRDAVLQIRGDENFRRLEKMLNMVYGRF